MLSGSPLRPCVRIALGLTLLHAMASAQNGLVYQVFVRSFADSPKDTRAAGEIGDLRGLRENLDYLNDGKVRTDRDLEAGILWLMPIFPSPTYHGYDVTDFRAVNPDYGTLQDIRDLVREAHRRRMRIILDVPFNHTSSEHPWFRDAVNNPASRYRKWYRFDGSGPGWRVTRSKTGAEVRYFALFDAGMPDLDYSNREVREQIKAIAQFWLTGVGVDGFRLDAAKHIFGDTFGALSEAQILSNNQWWRDFSDFVYRLKPNAILVGEVLGDQQTVIKHARGLDALLDEPFMKAARARISGGATSFLTEWARFTQTCRDVNATTPRAVPRKETFQPFIFLGSHDETPRLASFLEDRRRAGMQASVDEAYRLGMYLLMTVAKHPVLYNGDELMQPGYKWKGNPKDHPTSPGDGTRIYDETLREPFPWKKIGAGAPQTSWFVSRFDRPYDGISVEEQAGSKSMLSLVKALSNLRTEHPAFANGAVDSVLADFGEWIVFEKVNGPSKYLVLINTTRRPMDYKFHQDWYPRYAGARLLFWSDGAAREWRNLSRTVQHIQGSAHVPAYGLVLLRAR